MSNILSAGERAIETAAAPYAVYFKAAAAAVLAGAIAAGAWWVTATYYRLQISNMEKIQAQAIVIAQDRAMHQQKDQDDITAAVIADASARRQAQLQQTIANLQEVARHVTPETDRLFPMSCGFLRLHDAGARGAAAATVSLPAGKADADRCDVTESVAAAVIQSNYGLALGWKLENETWWSWYEQQKAKWDQYRASTQKEN